MRTKSPSFLHNADLSFVTWSGRDTDGFWGLQIDSLSDGSHGMTPFHSLQPLGLLARPVDPQGEVGALALRWFAAHEGFAIPFGDVRTEAALPELNKGATCVHDTGTYKGHPFHFTCTLDPVTNELNIKAHRAGGKVRITNAEGLTFEIDGTSVTISGATEIKLGGETPLALASLVSAQLSTLATAIQAAATTEKGAGGMGGMSALGQALSNWPGAVAASIAKGG